MELNISSLIAQVLFFSLTLTFIFKIKLLAFYLICEYLVNSERESEHYYCHQIESHEFAIRRRRREAIHCDLDFYFSSHEI